MPHSPADSAKLYAPASRGKKARFLDVSIAVLSLAGSAREYWMCTSFTAQHLERPCSLSLDQSENTGGVPVSATFEFCALKENQHLTASSALAMCTTWRSVQNSTLGDSGNTVSVCKWASSSI